MKVERNYLKMFSLGSIVAKIEADVSNFQRGLNDAERRVDMFGKRINSVSDKLLQFSTIAIGAGVAIGGVVTKKSLDYATQYEQQLIALTTLLGDREKAEAQLKKVEEKAKETPFNLNDLIDYNQLLISADVNAEDAMNTILDVGDAVSASGKGAPEMQRIIQNLQQIRNTGKATEMDMRQFATGGINMYKLLAESTGLPIEKLKEMDITYEMITEALDKANDAGGRYHNAMRDQMGTAAGLLSNLEDVIAITLKNVAVESGLYDAYKNVLAAIGQLVTDAGPKLISFLKSVGETLQKVNNFYQEHSTIINTITAFITGFFVPALVLVALQAGVNTVKAFANLTKEIIMFGVEGWKAIGMMITKTATFIKNTAAIIANKISLAAHAVATGISTAATWAFNTALVVLTSPIFLVVAAIVALIAIGYVLIKNWDTIKAKGQEMLTFLVGKFEGFVTKLQEVGNKIFDAILSPIRRARDEVSKVVDNIRDMLDFTKRHSPSVVDIVNRGVREVNSALSQLEFNTNLTPHAAALAVSSSPYGGPSIININNDLSGAIITNEFAAEEMGEKLGDSIIKRLQKNVRF